MLEPEMSDTIPFPKKKKKRLLGSEEVEQIAFFDVDGGKFWIDEPDDIAAIFSFLKQRGISIMCDPDE